MQPKSNSSKTATKKLASARGPRMIPVNSIDEYISLFSPDIRKQLQSLRQTILKAAPEFEEAIRYCMPTFRQNGNLVHFAAFKNHIGFYPTPSGIVAFPKELSGYVTSKGTVQFQFGEPIPHGLIAKIVKFRVQESLEKAAKKRK